MKLKFFGIVIATILLLVGCNTAREGKVTDRNENVEQTRFNDVNDNSNLDRGIGNDGATNINNRNKGKTRNISNRNNEDRYDVSKEAADKITDEITEIHYAYVLTTKNNAYVAAVLDNDDRHRDRMNGKSTVDDDNLDNANTRNIADDGDINEGDELTDEVKNKIADIVQSIDNDIENVYVTTNPDFADLTNDYMNDMNDGRPIRGFFDQFGNMIERVFPQNKR